MQLSSRVCRSARAYVTRRRSNTNRGPARYAKLRDYLGMIFDLWCPFCFPTHRRRERSCAALTLQDDICAHLMRFEGRRKVDLEAIAAAAASFRDDVRFCANGTQRQSTANPFLHQGHGFDFWGGFLFKFYVTLFVKQKTKQQT